MSSKPGIVNRLFSTKATPERITPEPESLADIISKIERFHGEYVELAAQYDNATTGAALDWGDHTKDAAFVSQHNALMAKMQTIAKVAQMLEAQLTDAMHTEYARMRGELESKLKAAQVAQIEAEAKYNKMLADANAQGQASQHAQYLLQSAASELDALNRVGERGVKAQVEDAAAMIAEIRNRVGVGSVTVSG